LLDLDNWVSEEYRVPGKPAPTEPSGADEIARRDSDELGDRN